MILTAYALWIIGILNISIININLYWLTELIIYGSVVFFLIQAKL